MDCCGVDNSVLVVCSFKFKFAIINLFCFVFIYFVFNDPFRILKFLKGGMV